MTALYAAVAAAAACLAAGTAHAVLRLSYRRELQEYRSLLAIERRRARLDRLTGVLNHTGLLEELHRWVAGSAPFAVLLVDLDDFKTLNARHGRTKGDIVLIDVAERLQGLVGDDGVVARLGCDDFVVVSPSPAPVLSRRLGHEVARTAGEPVDAVGRMLELHVSVGVVQALPGDRVSALLASAQVALHRAKTRGAGVAEFDAALGLLGGVQDPSGQRLRELTQLDAAAGVR